MIYCIVFTVVIVAILCIVFTVVMVVIYCIVFTVVIVVIHCIVFTVVIVVIYCIVFTVVIVVIWCIKRRQTEVKTVVIQPKRRPQTVTAKPKPQTNGMIIKILNRNYTMQIHMRRKLSRYTL